MKGIGCIVLCWLFLLLIPVNSQIKYVIVLMEENRSFDHMFGWFPGVDGLTGKECNQVNTSVPTSECIYVNQAQPQISPCDPDHGTTATTSKVFGQAALKKNDTSEATMSGFVEWEGMIGHAKTNYCDVMEMLTPEHLPIITTLASEFAIFDRFFAAYPGPTWPNRIFTLSGTSAGLTETGPWYHNEVGLLFPQPTIFDQIASEGLTWRNYFNDTPWELMLGSIAHNPENLAPMDQFYQDAALGNLPNFAWINPRSGINMTLLEGSNDHHPDHDISLGEQYYKDIYEALRASPQWNETLFIITYDEHGGFYDHVPTPLNVPPPGDGEKSYPDEGILFDRLGIRIPTLLISPWIPKGLVISEPPSSQKPANNSEFTLTSIIATTRKILGMTSPPLTARDAWSATFEHVLNLTSPRTDCPLHLPPTLPPSQLYSPLAEANMPINDLQKQILTVHAHLAGEDGIPPHVTCQAHVAEYAKMKYCEHADRTMQWKASKVDDSIVVVVRPGSSSDWLSTMWSVNVGTNVTFNTIAVFYQANGTMVVYCLDYSNYLITGTVGVSFCYPSVDPDSNRDPGQQWVWGNDATVRPFANSTLCLTNGYLDDDVNVYLRPCDPDNVAQRYAYHGYAPGNGYSGVIYFGDSANQLGILNITSLGTSINHDTFTPPVSHITVQ